MYQRLFITIVFILSLFATSFAYAGCEEDFSTGVAITEKAETAFKEGRWEAAAKGFELAADVFDVAANSCSADNAQTSRENAAKLRDNAVVARNNLKQGASAAPTVDRHQAYLDVAQAETKFEHGVALTEKNKYSEALPLFRTAKRLWQDAIPGLDEEDQQKARNNVETAAHNIAICERKGGETTKADESSADDDMMAQMFVYAITETMFDDAKEAYDRQEWKKALEGFTAFRDAFAELQPKLTDTDLLERGRLYDDQAKELSAECRKRLL